MTDKGKTINAVLRAGPLVSCTVALAVFVAGLFSPEKCRIPTIVVGGIIAWTGVIVGLEAEKYRGRFLARENAKLLASLREAGGGRGPFG